MKPEKAKVGKVRRKAVGKVDYSFGKAVIAALRETNEAIARGERLNVREYRVKLTMEAPSARDIQVLRHKLGCSQAVFAAFLGVPLLTLSSWERGKRHPSAMARRLLGEIKQNPSYWQARLTDVLRKAG